MYRLNNNYQSDGRSPQQIQKAIIVAWCIVCRLFRAREERIFLGNIHPLNIDTSTNSTQETFTIIERSAYFCILDKKMSSSDSYNYVLIQSYITTPLLMIIHHYYIKKSFSGLQLASNVYSFS